MYPTETMFPFLTNSAVTSFEAWTVPVPTGWGQQAVRLVLLDPTHLLDEVGRLGEELEQLDLKVGALGGSAPVGRRASNDDRAANELDVDTDRGAAH